MFSPRTNRFITNSISRSNAYVHLYFRKHEGGLLQISTSHPPGASYGGIRGGWGFG